MLYDRPVWDLLEEAISSMPSTFRGSDLVAWFEKQYPRVKASTVRAHITCATMNLSSRQHCRRPRDLLFKRADGTLERYDREVHGSWTKGRRIDDIESDSDDDEMTSEPGDTAENMLTGRSLSTYLAADLGEGIFSLPGDLTHRFDFVGEGDIAGIHIDREPKATPRERWGATSETVWLLQSIQRPGPRFVVFTRDRRLPILWLSEFGRLCPDVEFLFMDGTKVIDLREEG